MATVDVTYSPVAGRKFVTLNSWAGDAAFSPTPVADGQIEGPDALTLGADGVVTGSDGTYALNHITTAGVIESLSFVIGEVVVDPEPSGETGTGTATYAPPADMTLTIVQEPVDEYLTDGWSSPPETGEQDRKSVV